MSSSIDIRNWKLKEVKNQIEIVANDSIEFRNTLLEELHLPLMELTAMNRSDTNIDWDRMPEYNKLFFDYEGCEDKVKTYLEKSKVAKSEDLIIIYGWKEPAVKVPTKLFIDDWEGFVRSTKYETIIFSEDYTLIIEVSRDYYFHSNFKIM